MAEGLGFRALDKAASGFRLQVSEGSGFRVGGWVLEIS